MTVIERTTRVDVALSVLREHTKANPIFREDYLHVEAEVARLRADVEGAVARVAELEAQVADLQAEKRAYRAAGDELAAELDRLTRGQSA